MFFGSDWFDGVTQLIIVSRRFPFLGSNACFLNHPHSDHSHIAAIHSLQWVIEQAPPRPTAGYVLPAR
jgi:hypothetical protein